MSSFAVEREYWSATTLILRVAELDPSHVTRTGEIKDFVVTEESGIAKGIRRITAVTGHEAAEARRLADAFTARLNQLDAMSGPEKDAGLKSYTVVRRVQAPRGPLS